jgi:xylan 1,4-beta-xylosidase
MYQIENPILTGFNPDPSLCRVGEDYYIATSTFEWFPGVRIYHSRDLKNWSLVSTPLDSVALLDMKGNPDSGGIWAPCLSYADGKFWLLYTDVKIVDSPWKNGRNFLVTAPRWRGRGATHSHGQRRVRPVAVPRYGRAQILHLSPVGAAPSQQPP